MSNPEEVETPAVDLVIVSDTSTSMRDEAVALSQATEAAIEAAQLHCPSDLRMMWLGVEGTWRDTNFSQTVRQYLTENCGVPETSLRGRRRGEVPDGGAQKDGARAIEDIANHFDWRAGAKRALFYLSDEALEGGGSRVEAEDIEAANVAIEVAQRQGLTVYTYFGSTRSRHKAELHAEFARVAEATGGQAFTDQEGIDGFTDILERVICTTRQRALETLAAPASPEPSTGDEILPEPDPQPVESISPETSTSDEMRPEPDPQPVLTTTGEAVSASEMETKRMAANRIIKNHVIGSIGIGLVPVPLVDFVGVTALQLRMIRRLSEFYEVPFSDNRGRSILASLLGAGVSSSSPRWGASFFKLIPGLGTFSGLVAMSSVGGASTYAVGRTFVRYFERGQSIMDVSCADVQQEVQDHMDEGEAVVEQLQRERP